MCYRDEAWKSQGADGNEVQKKSLFDLKKDNPLIKKLEENLKGGRYPTGGVLLDLGEKIKFESKLNEFKIIRNDLNYTNEVLARLGENNLLDAIAWI